MRHGPTLLAVLAGIGLVAALGPRALAGDSEERGTVHSAHYDLSLSLPPGWHASRSRLVTRLLMPREVVSVGTFGMAPGSGGNCGREPARAIGRMRPGDGLVSVQEYVVTAEMRRDLGSHFVAEPRLEGLRRAEGAYPGGIAGTPVYTTTIPFREAGRAFDALVYFRGRPTPAARAEVAAILAGLDFGPHPLEFGSGA